MTNGPTRNKVRPKPDRTGAPRNHTGRNPPTLLRGRALILVGGRGADGVSTGALSLHVAQYAPCERVSRKPRTLRRSLITVSDMVGPPHRVHSIAISCLRLSSSALTLDQIPNKSRTIIGRSRPRAVV